MNDHMLLEKLETFSEFKKKYQSINEVSSLVTKLANTNLFDPIKGGTLLQSFIKRQFGINQRDLLMIGTDLYPVLNMDGYENVFSYVISSADLIVGIPNEEIAKELGSDTTDPAKFKVICSKGIGYLDTLIKDKNRINDEFVTNYKDMTRVMTLEDLTKYNKSNLLDVCKVPKVPKAENT